MDLFEKSQQTLELPSVLELLAGEAVSEPAKEACRAVRPSVYRTEMTQWLAETTAARDMMAVKGSPSFSGVRDVRGALARADMGGVLNTRELLSVAGVLTPTTGALVHNAGSCFVVLLAALLYDRKYKP